MRYWICPRCDCINGEKNTACDGCDVPAIAVMMLPNLQWLEFESIEKLDAWISLIGKMGGKVWRNK